MSPRFGLRHPVVRAAMRGGLPEGEILLRSADLYVDALDAASLTLVGTKVSAWANKGTATVNLEQTNDTNRPSYGTRTINGRPVLDFDKANLQQLVAGDVLNVGTGGLTVITAFAFDAVNRAGVVAKASNVLTGGHWAIVRDENWLYGAAGLGSNFAQLVNTSLNFRVVSMRWRRGLPGLIVFRIDGTELWSHATNNTSDITSTQIFRVGGYGAANFTLDGAVGMAAVFLRDLTDPELATVEAYLKDRWGTA